MLLLFQVTSLCSQQIYYYFEGGTLKVSSFVCFYHFEGNLHLVYVILEFGIHKGLGMFPS